MSLVRRLNAVFLCLLLPVFGAGAGVIAHWSFNSVQPDNDTTTGTLAPAIGTGTATPVGGVTHSFTASNGSSDTFTDNSNWRITGWPVQGVGNKSHGVRFTVSTAGYRNIRLVWDQRNSNTASKYARIQYTTNGVHFIDHHVIVMPTETWVKEQEVRFSALPGVDNNPAFGFRIVTEFESTATGVGPDAYAPSNPGSTYGTGGTLRFDMITLWGEDIGANPQPEVKLLNYNVWGAGATDWSTNSLQVRAIGRQLAYLSPDIITLQEIPNTGLSEMNNFVRAFLPGYFLATNRVSDGDKGNLIISRFPILRSWSNMGRSSLAQWGFNGVFTRDLFEAEIAVPGWNDPVHAFSVHLKAFNDEVSAPRRAAEASAISNFFVNVFLPVKGHRPHVLAGDFNEDIARPRSYEQGAMYRIINESTRLKLTTPRNPANNDERTWSSRNPNPTIRFDYILPGEMLFEKIVTNWIFRTDFLSPTPPGLLGNDSQVASDHLPLLTIFENPYLLPPPAPPLEIAARVTGQTVTISWPSVVGFNYTVQGTTDLANWLTISSTIKATETNSVWHGSVVTGGMFFRVVHWP
jgi:endonuclease/exonuclease/phosphatase family metal-dependent hydrolase